MRRIVFLCLLGLVSGCRDGAQTDKKPANDDSSRKALTRESTSVDVAKDFLVGSGFGADVQVVSSEEKATTLDKKPALALHLHWRGKGDEQRHDLFVIQEQRVKEFTPYDAGKSFDENVSTALRKLETP